MRRAAAAFAISLLVACGGDDDGTSASAASGSGAGTGGTGSTSDASSGDASSSSAGGRSCDGVGVPEMAGPIEGVEPSYLAGDPIDVGVPVDEDTRRVIVGIYEVGSNLYLGGTAEDAAGPTTRSMSFFAGVADGATGEFYLSIELCSTSVCTTPFVRNTYQRVDRTLPALDVGETYTQSREHVGGDGTPEVCPSTIPVQSFLIE